MMYAFRWWIYRIWKEYDKSLADLKRSAFVNPRNAVALYNLWVLAFEKSEYNNAKIYFEDTIESDRDWTFWDKAEQMLKETIKNLEYQALSASWAWSWSAASWTSSDNK